MKLFLPHFFYMLLAAGSTAFCQQVNQWMWIPNGPVRCIEKSPSGVFIGGKFDDVGPCTGHGVLLDSASAQVLPNSPQVNGIVCASASDSNGGWYIGGKFSYHNIINLAHILPNGQIDTLWAPNPDDTVFCMAFCTCRLFIGGNFRSIGSDSRNYIASIGTSNGIADAFWDPSADGSVRALVLDDADSVIYTGGNFNFIGGAARLHLARLHIVTGTILIPSIPYFDFNIPTDNAVRCMALVKDTLYFGGDFSSVANQGRAHFAAAKTVNSTLLPWAPSFNNAVYVMTSDSNRLFAGGKFTYVSSQSRKHVCSFSLSSRLLDSWNPDLDNTVYSLFSDSSDLYIGGDFINANSIPRKKIAKLDKVSGSTLGWDPHASNTVYTINKQGPVVFAGGDFVSVGGRDINNLAEINLITGRPTSFNPDVNGPVFCLLRNSSALYAGGNFTSVSGQTRKNFASIDVSNGAVLPLDIPVNGYILNLALQDNLLFLGGHFSSVNSVSRNNLAAADTINGTVSAWNPDADGTVNSIVPSGNHIYAGGYFTQVKGSPRSRLACIDLSTGFPTLWNPGANNAVYSIALHNNSLLAGGVFSLAAGQNQNFLAAIDTASGALQNWYPGLDGIVHSLSIYNDTLLAAGDFNFFGPARSRIARFGFNSNTTENWFPSCNDYVYTARDFYGITFAGGEFTRAGNSYHPFFAAFYPSAPSGITYASREENINVYPNPSGGIFNIKLPGMKGNELHFILFNTGGEAVAEKLVANSPANEYSFGSENLPAGIYFLEVETAGSCPFYSRVLVIK